MLQRLAGDAAEDIAGDTFNLYPLSNFQPNFMQSLLYKIPFYQIYIYKVSCLILFIKKGLMVDIGLQVKSLKG